MMAFASIKTPGGLALSFLTFLRPNQQATSARIHSSACRGYVVELDPADGGPTRLLESLSGKVTHFNSLERARAALRRRGVQQARLVQHHTCEELGSPDIAYLPRERGAPVLNATAP